MQRFPHKDLVSLEQLTPEELLFLLDTADRLKREWQSTRRHDPVLSGKILAMIFEKSSLRTRVTFEVGMVQLGGHAIYLSQGNFKLGERETARDVARNLERWVDGIMLRTFAHANVVEMAESVAIPVINGLSDYAHPCQVLADLQTIRERKGRLAGLSLAFIGDGNNMAASLAVGCALAGMRFTLATPPGYGLPEEVLAAARAIAATTGGAIETGADCAAAARGADVLYTDVWTSMGQEAERERRLRDFAGYQVNAGLLSVADPAAIVLHCLPAHRGEEITDEALEGPASAVLDEAENRLHAQKAVLALLLG